MNVTKERGFIRSAVLVLLGIILSFGWGSCAPQNGGMYGDAEEAKSVEQITLDRTELTTVISEGEVRSERLTATVTPPEVNRGTLNWSSAKEEVAIVDESGKITALSPGEAVITVRTENGKQAECKVTVYSESSKLKFTLSENGEFYSVTGIGSETAAVIVIPSKYQGKPVSIIGEGAFRKCKDLTGVVIPDSIKMIENEAFLSCKSLNSIELPNSIRAIGTSAFFGCTLLESITIPSSVETIGYAAFFGCTSLENVTILGPVKEIGKMAFTGCWSLKNITIPNSVETIGNTAFSGCSSLSSIELPNSIKAIESDAFFGCELLSSIELPNSVRVIESRTFLGCTSLKSVTILGQVERIESRAFEGCKSLNSITLPDSVKTIKKDAFYGCDSSLEVSYQGSEIPDGWDKDWNLFDNTGRRIKADLLNEK